MPLDPVRRSARRYLAFHVFHDQPAVELVREIRHIPQGRLGAFLVRKPHPWRQHKRRLMPEIFDDSPGRQHLQLLVSGGLALRVERDAVEHGFRVAVLARLFGRFERFQTVAATLAYPALF